MSTVCPTLTNSTVYYVNKGKILSYLPNLYLLLPCCFLHKISMETGKFVYFATKVSFCFGISQCRGIFVKYRITQNGWVWLIQLGKAKKYFSTFCLSEYSWHQDYNKVFLIHVKCRYFLVFKFICKGEKTKWE